MAFIQEKLKIIENKPTANNIATKIVLTIP